MSKQTDLINIPDAITVDGSGTAGFGVTPSPWRNLYGDKQVDIGPHSSVYSEAGNTTFLANNFYRNASNAFIYKTTSGASYVSLAQEKIIFAGAASGTAGNSFSFSERARFDSDGLKFNGDTAAANALNDYEEGTWVPTLGGNAVHDIQTGHYVKVGGLVYAFFAIRPTSLGTGSTNRISGLPFTTSDFVGISVSYYDGAATNHYSIAGGVTSNYIDIYLKTSATNDAYNSTNFFQNNARIYAQVTYRTTS